MTKTYKNHPKFAWSDCNTNPLPPGHRLQLHAATHVLSIKSAEGKATAQPGQRRPGSGASSSEENGDGLLEKIPIDGRFCELNLHG